MSGSWTPVPSTDKEIPAPDYDDMFDQDEPCSILKWNTLKDMKERRTEKCWFYVRRRAGVRKLKAKVMKTMRNQHSDKTNWKPRLCEFTLDPNNWSKSTLRILKYEKCPRDKQRLDLVHLTSVDKAALRPTEAQSFPIKTVSAPLKQLRMALDNNYAPEAETSSDSEDEQEAVMYAGSAGGSPPGSNESRIAGSGVRTAPPRPTAANEGEFRYGHLILTIRGGGPAGFFGELCCGSTRVRDSWVRMLHDFMVIYEINKIKMIDQPLLAARDDDEEKPTGEKEKTGTRSPLPIKRKNAAGERKELSEAAIREYVKFFRAQSKTFDKDGGKTGVRKGTPGLNANISRPPHQQLQIRFATASPEQGGLRRRVVADPKRPGWVLFQSTGVVNTTRVSPLNLIDYSVRVGVHNLNAFHLYDNATKTLAVTVEVTGRGGENVKLRDAWTAWFVCVKAHAMALKALEAGGWYKATDTVSGSPCYVEAAAGEGGPRIAFKTWPPAKSAMETLWVKEVAPNKVPRYRRMEAGKRVTAAAAKINGEEVKADVVYDLFEIYAQTKVEMMGGDARGGGNPAKRTGGTEGFANRNGMLDAGGGDAVLLPSPSGLASPWGSPRAPSRVNLKSAANVMRVDYTRELEGSRPPLLPAPWEVFDEIPFAREHRFQATENNVVEFKDFFREARGNFEDWWSLETAAARRRTAVPSPRRNKKRCETFAHTRSASSVVSKAASPNTPSVTKRSHFVFDEESSISPKNGSFSSAAARNKAKSFALRAQRRASAPVKPDSDVESERSGDTDDNPHDVEDPKTRKERLELLGLLPAPLAVGQHDGARAEPPAARHSRAGSLGQPQQGALHADPHATGVLGGGLVSAAAGVREHGLPTGGASPTVSSPAGSAARPGSPAGRAGSPCPLLDMHFNVPGAGAGAAFPTGSPAGSMSPSFSARRLLQPTGGLAPASPVGPTGGGLSFGIPRSPLTPGGISTLANLAAGSGAASPVAPGAPQKCWGKLTAIGTHGVRSTKVLVVGFVDGENRTGLTLPVARMTSVSKEGDVAFAVSSQGAAGRHVFAAPTEELRDRWVKVLLNAIGNLDLLPPRKPGSPTTGAPPSSPRGTQVDFERGTLLWKLPEGIGSAAVSPPLLPIMSALPSKTDSTSTPLSAGPSPLMTLNAKPKGGPSIHQLIHNINVVSGFPGSPSSSVKAHSTSAAGTPTPQRSVSPVFIGSARSGTGGTQHSLLRAGTPGAGASPRTLTGPHQALLVGDAGASARGNGRVAQPSVFSATLGQSQALLLTPTMAGGGGTPTTATRPYSTASAPRDASAAAASPTALTKLTFDEARDVLGSSGAAGTPGTAQEDAAQRKPMAWF